MTSDLDRLSIINRYNAHVADYSAHVADHSAHVRDFMEVLRTGVYHFPFLNANYAAQAAALTANRLLAMPFLVARDLSIDRTCIQVTVADAGTTMRLGLYNAGDNLYPGALNEDYGTVSTAGVAVVAITHSPAKSLTKGLYWLVGICDGTPEIRRITTSLSLLGCTNAAIGVQYFSWRIDDPAAPAWHTALPDPFPAAAAVATDLWLLCPRISSLD